MPLLLMLKKVTSKIAIIITTIIFIFLLQITYCNAGAKKYKFLLLNSKSYGTYILCEKGIKETLSKEIKGNIEIKTLYLSKESSFNLKEIIYQYKPTLIFSIGTRASLFLYDLAIKQPVISTFIIDKTAIHLKKENFLAISLDVPLKKRLEFLCKIMPVIKGAILSDEIMHSKDLNISKKVCSSKIRITAYPFDGSIESSLKKLSKKSINAFFITPNPNIFGNKEIIKYTLLWGIMNKVAICGLSTGYVKR